MEDKKKYSSLKIFIIGAGISGLACANQLLSLNPIYEREFSIKLCASMLYPSKAEQCECYKE